jgi:hypothetical protein
MPPALDSKIEGQRIVIQRVAAFAPNVAPLATSLPDFGKLGSAPDTDVLAVTDRYLVLVTVYSWDDVQAKRLPTTETYYVLHKQTHRWGKVTVPGNNSTVRIFGSWMAVREADVSNGDTRPGPGRDTERAQATSALPDVHAAYEGVLSSTYRFRGELELVDLEGERRIPIHTESEDSEILSVEGNRVIYRIDNAIYQAQLGDGTLGARELLVRGDDVPEIHWVFAGPAQ